MPSLKSLAKIRANIHGGANLKSENLDEDEETEPIVDRTGALATEPVEPREPPVAWSRIAGQPCKVPNTTTHTIHAGTLGGHRIK